MHFILSEQERKRMSEIEETFKEGDLNLIESEVYKKLRYRLKTSMPIFVKEESCPYKCPNCLSKSIVYEANTKSDNFGSWYCKNCTYFGKLDELLEFLKINNLSENSCETHTLNKDKIDNIINSMKSNDERLTSSLNKIIEKFFKIKQ